MAIGLVALALRLGFVLTSPAGPLFWDEPLYETWAKLYQGAFAALLGAGSGPSLAEAVRTSLSRGRGVHRDGGGDLRPSARSRALFRRAGAARYGDLSVDLGLARAAGGDGAGSSR